MEEKKKFSKGKAILLLILLVLSAILIGFVIISPYYAAVKHYESVAKKKVADGGEAIFMQSLNSIVYDKDDNEIITFESEGDKYYTYAEDMSDVVKNAFVMLIDQGFYRKKGADLKTLVQIARDDRLAAKTVEGISPITRLIARDMFLSYDLEKDNSVMEVFVANELEKAYSKEQIFEFFVNNLYFNNGYFGVEAAARGYFGRELSKLSVSEIAFLAAVAEDPQLDPYTDKESLMVKRNVIITRLLEEGVVDKVAYFSAISEIIELGGVDVKKYNYIETYVIAETIHALMESEGFVFQTSFESEEERANYDVIYKKLYNRNMEDLFRKGYKIHTSFDMSLQEKLQADVDKALSISEITDSEGNNLLKGAAVCIDNETGLVVALVGGSTALTSEYVYNRAFEKHTPAGMVMAPLSVYVPFIEWHHNLDYIMYREEALDGTYINKVTLRDAILSYNSETNSKMFEQLKPGYIMSVLDRVGFTKAFAAPLTRDGWGMVYASSVELANGYETLANDGVYARTTCIESILDNKGAEVYKRTTKKANVYAANDSRLMTELLEGNVSDGFLSAYKPDNAVTAAMAAKVGNGYESFFVGYSTYYTVAAYAGYEGLTPELSGKTSDTLSVAGNVWKAYMTELHKDKKITEFPESGPYSPEVEVEQEVLQPTTERPSLGGEGGHPGDGDDHLGYYSY